MAPAVQKTWFVTGVSSGFGHGVAELLLERGDRVAGTYRRAGGTGDLKAKYGDKLWLAQLDVTASQDVRTVIDRAFSELGRIDVVLSNAGYGILGAAEELTDAQIENQIATNLTGSIQVIRAVTPHLRDQGGGRVIQVSTMGGLATFPAASLYHASKWGIEGFVESVRHELAPFNIGITLIEPGVVGTNFGRNLVIGDAMDAYAEGPVGQTRAFFGSGDYHAPGDAAKVAQAIVNAADQNPAPLRLALGTDAYEAIRAALRSRLAELEANKSTSTSTDVSA